MPAGNSVLLTGNPPMAWLEALADGRSSRLYVRPLELLPASGPAPSIRVVAQPVELLDGVFFSASTDTVAEGSEEAQPQHLVATGPHRPAGRAGIGGSRHRPGRVRTILWSPPTWSRGSCSAVRQILRSRCGWNRPPLEPLRLRLRTRGDDRISQGDRLLNLRISRYRVVSEGEETVGLPPALDLIIRDDEPPTVQQVLVSPSNRFSCVHLNGGSVRCAGANDRGQILPPEDLGPVVQLGVGWFHSCAVTVSGRVRCWGSDEDGRSTPPLILSRVVQLSVGNNHSCALTVEGQVHCWGRNGNNQASPPDELGPNGALGPVAQVGLGQFHSCALTVAGRVHCWGFDGQGRLNSPDGLVTQLAVGQEHNCAVTAAGEVKCWGAGNAKTTVPGDLGPAVQVGVGDDHSCAVTVAGRVRCWGSNAQGRRSPPGDLGVVTQLVVGWDHNCALTVSGQLRCWGNVVDISFLPAGLVTAIEYQGLCALLAEGSVYCPDNPELVSPGLGPSDVVMSVWPRQLEPGQRAAIRFADLRETTGAFTARIEVFGERDTDIGSYYRLLDSNGMPLVAESDGSYLVTVSPATSGGYPWLEALGDGRLSRLYVRPLELLSASSPAPSIRKVAQPVELIDGVFFSASTDTVTEGTDEAQLSIWLALAHTGLEVELELAVIGTALAGSDYTLVAAEPGQGIVLGGEANSTITLRVEFAPTEPLRLRLRTRVDDRISQGDRFLNLRISRYRVVSEGGGTVDLPSALDLIILDDELPTVQQVLVSPSNQFSCVHLNGGSVRCAGADDRGRATPPGDDLGPFAELAVGHRHSCALTVLGEVRCWGFDRHGESSPPAESGPGCTVRGGHFSQLCADGFGRGALLGPS